MDLLKRILIASLNLGYYLLLILYALFATICLITSPLNYYEIQDLKKQNSEIYSAIAVYYSQTLNLQGYNQSTLLDLSRAMIQTNNDSIQRDTQLMNIVSKINQNHSDTFLDLVKKPSYEYLKAITVTIRQQIKGGNMSWVGTGVILKETDDFTYIVTNNHVCDNTEDFVCMVYDNDIDYPIEIVKKNTVGYDVQLVKITGKIPNKRPVKGIADIKQQDKVYMVGNNLGRGYFYSEGVIAGFDAKNDMALIAALPTGPGNSGAGIIDVNGNLVALVYAGSIVSDITLDLTHAICVNSEILRLFLDGYITKD